MRQKIYDSFFFFKVDSKITSTSTSKWGELTNKKNESEDGEIEHASYCQQAELSVYFRYLALDGAGVSYAGGMTTQ